MTAYSNSMLAARIYLHPRHNRVTSRLVSFVIPEMTRLGLPTSIIVAIINVDESLRASTSIK